MQMPSVFDAFLRNGVELFIAARLAPSEQEHAEAYYTLLAPSTGATIVDMGCGSGGMGSLLQRIDPSLTVLNVVNEPALVAFMHYMGRDCVEASFESVPIPDACADIVTFNESLGHGNLAAALAEATRILRPGGTLFIKDFTTQDPKLEKLEMTAWGYVAYSAVSVVQAAYNNGLSVELIAHPPMYMKHWQDLIALEPAAMASAAKHPPESLGLRMAVYKFTKGALRDNTADCVWQH